MLWIHFARHFTVADQVGTTVDLRRASNEVGQRPERRKQRRFAAETHLVLGGVEARITPLGVEHVHESGIGRAEHRHIPGEHPLHEVNVLATPAADVEIKPADIGEVGVVHGDHAVAERAPATGSGREVPAGSQARVVLAEDDWTVGGTTRGGGKPDTPQDVAGELNVNVDEEQEAVMRQELCRVLETDAAGKRTRHAYDRDRQAGVSQPAGGHSRGNPIHFARRSFLGEQHDQQRHPAGGLAIRANPFEVVHEPAECFVSAGQRQDHMDRRHTFRRRILETVWGIAKWIRRRTDDVKLGLQKCLLQVGVASDWDGHLTTTFELTIDEQQVQQVVGAVQRVDSMIRVEYVFVVDDAATLTCIHVNSRHHLTHPVITN